MKDISIAVDTLKVIWYLCNAAFNLTAKYQQDILFIYWTSLAAWRKENNVYKSLNR